MEKEDCNYVQRIKLENESEVFQMNNNSSNSNDDDGDKDQRPENASKFVSFDPLDHDSEKKMLEEILATNYGLLLTAHARLGGFDDLNFRVDASRSRDQTGDSKDEFESCRYHLRIVNAADSQDAKRIEGIHAMMRHCYDKGLVTQLPVVGLHGNELTYYNFAISGGQSIKHIVSLRTFIPGRCKQVDTLPTHDLFQMGAYVAQVRLALQDFHHPYFDTFTFSWSLSNTPYLHTMALSVQDETNRRLAIDIINVCSEKCSNVESDLLPKGQIHGDIGPRNIIFPDEQIPMQTGDCGKSSKPQDDSVQQAATEVSRNSWGLIDFHDTHYTFTLNELAICASRLLASDNESHFPQQSDIMDIPGHLLAGYVSVIPLNPLELEIFPYMVIGHLCIVLIGNHYYLSLNPANAAYFQHDKREDWMLLKSMWEFTPEKLMLRWKVMVASYSKDNNQSGTA